MQQTVDVASPGVTRSLALVLEFFRDDGGQDLLEYAFLAAFVGIAGLTALNAIGPTVANTYSSWVSPTTGAPALWEPAPPWNSGS
jgi:Flp pilus assembly pilin Flp